MNFGTTEIILIVAVVFLLFGASRLPKLAKSLGESRRAFKEGLREAEEAERKEMTAGTPQINTTSDTDIKA